MRAKYRRAPHRRKANALVTEGREVLAEEKEALIEDCDDFDYEDYLDTMFNGQCMQGHVFTISKADEELYAKAKLRRETGYVDALTVSYDDCPKCGQEEYEKAMYDSFYGELDNLDDIGLYAIGFKAFLRRGWPRWSAAGRLGLGRRA